MSEPSIFQAMAKAGYLLLDPPHPASPGGSRLLVAVRAAPTGLHFDPELIELCWRDPDQRPGRTKLTLNSSLSGAQQVCAGPVVLHDRHDKRVHFYMYGGTVEGYIDAGLTVYTLGSAAPILEMTDDLKGVAEQLAAETEALLAKIHAEWGLNDEGFRQWLIEIDPLRLYTATVRAVLSSYKRSSALIHSFHPFDKMLLDEKEWLSRLGHWEISTPGLDGLFARG